MRGPIPEPSGMFCDGNSRTATMKVKEFQPTHLPYATVPNVPQGDVIMEMPRTAMPAYYTDATQDHATFQGLYKFTSPFLPNPA